MSKRPNRSTLGCRPDTNEPGGCARLAKVPEIQEDHFELVHDGKLLDTRTVSEEERRLFVEMFGSLIDSVLGAIE